MRIAVIGLGRIGGQILRELSSVFEAPLGLDLDPERAAALRREGLRTTTDYQEITGYDVYLVAVSTGPRMEKLYAAAAALVPAAGALVSVESTVTPGTMERLARDFSARGLEPGRDLHLVHTPHRILFGHESSIFGQPRVMGGITPACLARGVEFYRPLVPEIHTVAEIRLAELTKIVENSLRYVEIACAEALALHCREAGLDFEELRRLVATKGNVRLLKAEYGIGGECLTKDAVFLHEATGCRLLADALAIDEEYRHELFREARAPRVLVKGLTFKPGWKDLGHSRAMELVSRLQAAGCQVWVEDPLYAPEELAALGLQPWRPGVAVDKVVSWGKVEKGRASVGEDPDHR